MGKMPIGTYTPPPLANHYTKIEFNFFLVHLDVYCNK